MRRRRHVLNARSRPSATLHNGGSINVVDLVNKLNKKEAATLATMIICRKSRATT